MANRDAPRLPGFYFDEKKNRYFKLIPGQEHINPLTGEALNQPKHSGRSKVKKLHKKCLRKRQKNIYSLVRSREIHHTFSNAISDCVLTSIFDKTFQEDNFSNTHVVYEYDEANISRILPSSSYKKVLLQSGALTLTLVDGFDHSDNNALTMAVRYHFPADNGSLITDFSFADTPHTEEAILAAIVPPNGGSSYLIWGPDIEHCIHRKDQKEYIGCCKWHQDYMVYGVGSNFVLVYDCDDHFGNRNRPYVGAVHVKSSTNKLNHLTACECTQSVVYTGHRNGAIFGYDRRMLEQGACTTINSGRLQFMQYLDYVGIGYCNGSLLPFMVYFVSFVMSNLCLLSCIISVF